jgi:chromosome partitioning protein|tara:strand:+ start:491 stop:1138 length:648 start_codon:yes stop_codon:yes gene_type:complete
LTKVLTFANVKGGSGKSTLCVNVAATLVKLGNSVAVVDADPQKSTFDWISTTTDHLLSKVICCDISSANEVKELGVDYVLIDTQGSLNKEMYQFLAFSSIVLVPCRVSRDDIIGQGWIQIFLKKFQNGEHDIPILAVLTGVNKRSTIFFHVLQQLKNDGTSVAKSVISQRVCFAETNVNKRSVVGYNKFAESEVYNLTREILAFLNDGDKIGKKV